MTIEEGTFFETHCMFVCDQITLRILDANENAVAKFGESREDLIDKKLTDLGTEFDLSDETYALNAQLKSSLDEVWQMRDKNGETHFVQFSTHLINYKGHPAKMVVAHDISEIITTNKISAKIMSSPIGFQNFPMAEIEWNKDLRILRWSSKAEELFGWTQEEAASNANLLKEFVYKDDLKFVQQELNETIQKKGKTASLVNRNLTKSGEVKFCEWYNTFMYNANGQVVSVYSIVIDVTERVEALERSKRSMQSYRDLFDSISDAIYLVNEQGEILGANKGLKGTFGYEPEEVIGKSYKILSAPGKFDEDRIYNIWNDKDKGSGKFEGWGKKKNGEVFPSEMLVNTGTYFAEKVLIIIERDISDRKLAEEELQKRERLFSELFNTSPLGIVLLNEHNEIAMMNKGFEEIFGYSMMEVEGLELDRIIIPEGYMADAIYLTETETVTEVVTQRLSKTGEPIDVIIYAIPIRVEGRMIAKYGIYVDITDRKRAEQQLISSLKEKEVLLAEIHHRVKNNLAVITGLLELQSYNTENQNARNILKESQMRINSIALVHEKLYQNENLSEIQIHVYIRELVQFIEQTMSVETVPVNISYDLDEVSLVITQAIPCGLLLNEVLTNSFKYAFVGRDQGSIKIEFKQKKDELIFRICDNGVGFSDMETSKKNSSLGMKLIRTLAKQINAKTNVSNNNGAMFEFRFKKEGE